MLPTITQRLMMVAAIAAGALSWWLIFPQLLPSDGSAGISLIDARAGLWLAAVLLLVFGLPALASAIYVGAAGNPLSGIFTVGFALMILAGLGGSAQGLLIRQEAWASGAGGGLFVKLEIELVLWATAWCFLMFLMRRFRTRVRDRLVPRRLKTPYSPAGQRLSEEDTPKFVLHVTPIVSGLLCAGIGWLLCMVLIQNAAGGQVIGAILLAFTIGALTARIALPTGNVVFLVLSPLLTGFVAYAHAAVIHSGASGTDIIGLLHRGALIGPAMTLPIHWASAGMVGVATGIGIAQAIDRVRYGELEAAAQAEADAG
ncbi:MAG: hypothetical protein AAGA29_13260 [Planctomycetota bacterium]